MLRLRETITSTSVKCPVSMATAVALFPVSDLEGAPCEISVPIYDELELRHRPTFKGTPSWTEAVGDLAQLTVADPNLMVTARRLNA